MNLTNSFIDKYNVIGGGIVSVLTYILGPRWVLFVAFLALNIGDWLSGWLKARLTNVSSSSAGLTGVVKKLGYWLMILLAFGVSIIFVEIGEVLGVDLQITSLLGWFVLANLTVNEIRSIIENFVEAGYPVPAVLKKGLAVASGVLDKMEGTDEDVEPETYQGVLKVNTSDPDKDIYRFESYIPIDELAEKDEVRFKVETDSQKNPGT